MTPVLAKDAVLVNDGNSSYQAFAERAGIIQIGLITGDREHVLGCYHIQNVNAYTSRFKGWLCRFNGVASKYLASYLGWRRDIERDGDKLKQRYCIAAAFG